MCGICGVAVPSQSRIRVNESRLVAMRDSLTYRGPDDAGILIDGSVGLGHRRLIRDVYFDNFAVYSPARQRQLFTAGAYARMRDHDPYRTALACIGRSDAETLLDKLLAADLKTYLHELLMKQDQMSMAASLESRAPFLDHKLVEFATGKLVPVDTGGKIRSYNILRKLAGRLEEYPARKLSCARRSLLTRFGALPELRTQAAFSPRKSSFHARRWRMLTGGLDSSSLVKTALSDLSHLKTAAESKPVAEAFSGGVEIIERFADEWRELCAEGPCDQPFFRPEWIESYMRAFAPQKRLLIVTARVNGRLRALLPLVEGRALFHGLPVRMLRSPANMHSCRFDLAHGAGQDVPTAVRAVWQLLRERRGWDLIELRLVPEGGASESLLSLASSDGHLTGQWKMSPGPYITLPGQVTTLEAALKHTTSKFRYSVRRRQRKLEEEGELRLISTTEADPTELERFYQLERAGWKGEEGTAIACAAETRKFYDGVARSATRFGYLSLYRLDCGDRTVAMHYGLTYGGRYFLIKPAYDEHFSHGAPGHVITSEVLREILAQGAKEFDFLTPQMEWKREWATAARPHAFCYIFARSFVGWTLHTYKFRLRPLRDKLFASAKRHNMNPEIKI